MERDVSRLLIPPRDSDSSDDDFEDALEIIENCFDNELVTVVEPPQTDDGPEVQDGVVEVDGVETDALPSSNPSSVHSSSRASIRSLESGTELTASKDMDHSDEVTVELHNSVRSSSPVTPLPSIVSLPDQQSDSFISYKTANNSMNQESTEKLQFSTEQAVPSPEYDDALASMVIKNLDTGQTVTMDKMEELLKDADPLSKYLKRKYTDYDDAGDSDTDDSTVYNSVSTINTQYDQETDGNVHKKSLLGKKAFKKIAKKSIKAVKHKTSKIKDKVSKKESESVAEYEVQCGDINVFPNPSYKNLKQPDVQEKFQIVELQNLNQSHVGPIWIMKFSMGGKVLASAGADKKINIWVLKSQWNHFLGKISDKSEEIPSRCETSSDNDYFEPVPFRSFEGHTSPVLDLNWSKQCFLLSSGMDQTVRLWHIARRGPLCCFKHPDSVPAIAFHPLNDVYFLSGCLDGKIRLWHIPEKKMSSYYSLNHRSNALITAINFDRRGKRVRAFIGTYDGRITVLNVTMTNSLEYHTSFDIRSTNRSNSARKITSIEQRPHSNSMLITSNDSRIRLYDVENFQLTCKYKGLLNQSSQIKASFSHDGRFIISGDEKNFVYFWESDTHYKLFNHHGKGPLKKQLRRDKNDCYYRFCAHVARVTCAMFAPEALRDTEGFVKEIFVTADAKGNIKVFLNCRFT